MWILRVSRKPRNFKNSNGYQSKAGPKPDDFVSFNARSLSLKGDKIHLCRSKSHFQQLVFIACSHLLSFLKLQIFLDTLLRKLKMKILFIFSWIPLIFANLCLITDSSVYLFGSSSGDYKMGTVSSLSGNWQLVSSVNRPDFNNPFTTYYLAQYANAAFFINADSKAPNDLLIFL